MNKGFIYKITNKINGKVYIGQTIKTVNKRFKEHINSSKCKSRNSYNYPLCKALRKYGINNFSVEKIEELQDFTQREIDERETYWIKYYNSINKNFGYNQLQGGKTTSHLDLDENKVIDLYNELKTLSSVATILNCSVTTVGSILTKNGIKVTSSMEHCKSKSKDIFQYDCNFNLLNKFNSFNDAGNWLIKNNISNAKNNIYAGNAIKYALKHNRSFSFGYIWVCVPNFTDKEKELFINRCKNENKQKYEKSKRNPKNNNLCPICGNWKSDKSELCQSCRNNKLLNKNNSYLEQKHNINREILKQEIRKTSFTKLSKKYEVSDNAIRKWCKKYGLPFKSSEIKKYSDEEWEAL